jgi:protein involved in polysaccharide export with SLBB domain
MRSLSSKLWPSLAVALLCAATLFGAPGMFAGAQDQTPPLNSGATNNDDAGQKARPATETGSQGRRILNSSLQLGVGDLVEMTVYGVPELATKTRISGRPRSSGSSVAINATTS